jgi:hypothetical protein
VVKYFYENKFAGPTADAHRAEFVAHAVHFPIKPVCQKQRAFLFSELLSEYFIQE